MLRTRRLAAGLCPALQEGSAAPLDARGGGLVYTVESGFRAVVREVRFYYEGPAAGLLVVWGVAPAAASLLILWVGGPLNPAAYWSGQSQGDTVMEAGDRLYVYSSHLPTAYYVSGALLPLP